MTYRCGLGGFFGTRDPAIQCDGDGCATIFVVPRRLPSGMPPSWFLEGKAPPKWRKVGDDEHLCPECRAKGAKEPSPVLFCTVKLLDGSFCQCTATHRARKLIEGQWSDWVSVCSYHRYEPDESGAHVEDWEFLPIAMEAAND